MIHPRGLWAGLVLLAPLAGLGDNNLANERQQLQGHHYETLWRVDCQQAQREWLAWIDSHPKQNNQTIAQLITPLKLCGIIYNTEDNYRYRSCPNFTVMSDYLTGSASSPLPDAEKTCAQTPLE